MINIGLIGFGKYGKKYFKNIIDNKELRIIKILRKKKDKSKIFTNNKKKFFNIKNIDLYIIASPANTHSYYLDIIMKRNKHVIVEKPLVKSYEEFLRFKKNLKKFKKIILINHTDLNSKAYLRLKKKIKKIGKIISVKLIYGKKDPYFLKSIKNSNDLPFFEWLPHPLSVITDLFKNMKFDLTIKEKKLKKNKYIFQNLEVIFFNKKFDLKVKFSNDYKHKKRNLDIIGSKGSLYYKGYNNNKVRLVTKYKSRNLIVKDDNPINNLLKKFINKYYKKSKIDDRKIINQTTGQLFYISNKIE